MFEAIADIAVTTSKPVLKNEYKGKLIYVQDGGGKSLIKKYNPDVVDSDEILKEIVGKYVTEGDKTFDRVPQEYRGQAMDEYNAKIRAAHNAGKTVLTANIQMLPEADVVIYNNSATDTMNRTNDEARDNRFRGEARAKKHTEEVNKFLEEHPDVESHKLSPGQYASDVLTT